MYLSGMKNLGTTRYFLQHQSICYVDAFDHTLCGGTGFQVGRKGLSCIRGLFTVHLQMKIYPDPGDFQYVSHILYIAFHLCPVSILPGGYMFFGQSPGQCPHHSAPCSRDNVVQRGCMFLFRLDPVKTLYPAVDSIIDRLIEPFYHCLSCRSLFYHVFLRDL